MPSQGTLGLGHEPAIAATRRPGRPPNASAPSPEVELLRPHESTVRQWLAEGLRLTKIYRRLRAEGLARLLSTAPWGS